MNTLIAQVAKLKTSFTTFLDAGMYTFSSSVYSALNGSPDFPLTQALLPGLLDDITAFNVALDNARGLGKVAVQIKNNMRLQLEAELRLVAYSCVFEANGNKELLLKTKLELVKDRTPAILINPKGVMLKDGDIAGKLECIVEGGKNFKSLDYKITPDPLTENSIWSGEVSLKRKHVFYGLESQKKYWIVVHILGPKEQEFISAPVSRVAQ